ncbi:hypothetical protein TD95_004713 [Thielaviopsis punctulata]|uniref:2,4-dienoyl-CoA reductase [(3E)-enoyl-CoA-producing] n=1 Tax=Thielaviopsis punctulata TaxID=72032 RepID=A0A0F4ZGQ4_9PEZI|nr:hypothetical protein TD95_004713 [Thielaviopsis punctulata]
MPVEASQFVSSVWKDGIFDGRVVFVTGGAGTICSAQTRALVKLGANACIIGRNQAKTEAMAKDLETARIGSRVLGIGGCDVRKMEHLQAAAESCVKELGAIDFVIAGAAGNFVVPISGMSSNAFKSVMDIDVLGTFNTVKATIPYLIESAQRNRNAHITGAGTGGRFLALSATFHYTGMPLQAHVAAAKAGVDSLVASISLEYGPYGVTANAIAPGPIAGTEGMDRLAGDVAMEQQGRGVPSGRWGTVRDIADATVYLFSDAGNYVNGQIIPVDGASWRRQGSHSVGVGMDKTMQYPDFILQGIISSNIKKGQKSSKL